MRADFAVFAGQAELQFPSVRFAVRVLQGQRAQIGEIRLLHHEIRFADPPASAVVIADIAVVEGTPDVGLHTVITPIAGRDECRRCIFGLQTADSAMCYEFCAAMIRDFDRILSHTVILSLIPSKYGSDCFIPALFCPADKRRAVRTCFSHLPNASVHSRATHIHLRR